jgi:hypothetical protein
MLCMWDNGSTHPNTEQFNLTNPLSVSPDQIYNIPHNFSSAGDYTLQCNMSNFVSSQKLEFNVSKVGNIKRMSINNFFFCKKVTIYDKIIGFLAFPKYYVTGSNPVVGQPIDPQGPNNNLLPLKNNVTFFFNYTQGK